MLGRRQAQAALFDVGNVFPLQLRPGTFHAQLAEAAPHLFRDEEFLAFYSETQGRPSVPPSELALLTLLQFQADCSDEEAVERSGYDLRWAAVLRREAGKPLCAKSTFQLFRAHLVLHEQVRALFEASLKEARRKGLLKGGKLRVAVDTKPMLGRGKVLDTYNLLAAGIKELVKALSGLQEEEPEAWIARQGMSRYFLPSFKGSLSVDWSEPAARQEVLSALVADARGMLLSAGSVKEADRGRVKAAAELLEALLLQDVVETPDASGTPTATLKEGTAAERMPSVTDPDQRHGRKSKSKTFIGHKASVVVDIDSQLILDCQVLSGNAADATGVLEALQRVEEATGQEVEQVLGDCAYGSGETREAFVEAKRELVAKVPQESSNQGKFPKSAFEIDLERDSVTCPGGQTTTDSCSDGEGGRIFRFGARCEGCVLRSQCTSSVKGRTVKIHPQEKLLRAARALQQSPEGQALLRQRVVVEHGLARLSWLGIGQARYFGRKKSAFQLLLSATVANLRRSWNWKAEKEQRRAAQAASKVLSGAVREACCDSYCHPLPLSVRLRLPWGLSRAAWARLGTVRGLTETLASAFAAR